MPNHSFDASAANEPFPRHPPARGRHRHPADPGTARPRLDRDDGPLHARQRAAHADGHESTGPTRTIAGPHQIARRDGRAVFCPQRAGTASPGSGSAAHPHGHRRPRVPCLRGPIDRSPSAATYPRQPISSSGHIMIRLAQLHHLHADHRSADVCPGTSDRPHLRMQELKNAAPGWPFHTPATSRCRFHARRRPWCHPPGSFFPHSS
jgi:hypothetical protein